MSKNLILKGKSKSIGDFNVIRVLPQSEKRSIGPFIFFDQMLRSEIKITKQGDVRPHPHIGLATLTYLFEGASYHQDSLGHKQLIQANDIALMISGQGIAHSERSALHVEPGYQGKFMQGLQFWLALPQELEQCPPEFLHYPNHLMPCFEISKNIAAKLALGQFKEFSSPVKNIFNGLLLDLKLKPKNDGEIQVEKILKNSFSLENKKIEFAFFILSGDLKINGELTKENELFIFDSDENSDFFELTFSKECHVILFGGKALPEPRYMWWNLVATRKELIVDAAVAWKNNSFAKVPDDDEFIPLPDESYLHLKDL